MRNSIPEGGNAEKQKADLLFRENHGKGQPRQVRSNEVTQFISHIHGSALFDFILFGIILFILAKLPVNPMYPSSQKILF